MVAHVRRGERIDDEFFLIDVKTVGVGVYIGFFCVCVYNLDES